MLLDDLNENEIVLCPILMYTSVIPNDNGDTRFCTTIEKFELDMQTLLRSGYTPISLRESYRCRKGEGVWPSKPLCVIFEYGYRNNYTLAFPVIKKLNIPVSIFVATDLVGLAQYEGVENFCPHFGWNEAKEMTDSGLVDIYPLWHPFDNGKPLVDEVQKKINLINDNLKSGDASFAFAYNDCGDHQLDELNSVGVKMCISNCNHITSTRINRGMLPSLSVDYTSDVIDLICQYVKLIDDALKKDTANTLEVSYEEPSAEVLSASVVLPIDKNPIARNYLRHAFPLSVLQAANKERAERIVLSEYIDVIYRPWDNWYDYHNHLYNSWDCLEYRRMTPDLIDENGINVIEYIVHALKLGYYCDIWLDTYYIPGKPGYGQKHMTHGILIFSYFADSREFGALSYNSVGNYGVLHVPIKSVFMGCCNSYFHYINLIKNNPRAIVEYNVRELYEKLNDYLNSVCHDDNKRYNKKCTQQYYNYEATLKFIECFCEKTSKDRHVHMTSLYSFAEQKRVMMWRIKSITDKENLPLNVDETYSSAVKQTERLINLGIKLNLTRKNSICNSMKNIMKKLCCDEKESIELVLSALREKLSL